ncbi:hypothetical protein QYE76_033463 [Lolium multiflorum]|uniref:Integrase catalytic domain-containing protein n=1 Tax=Lolium multiflorum TaxID=4521 RepID=A0AAD8QWP9_LOLMU|nr:hypothetical protein QYE76_033463 [Lolium multiflorum]
MEYSRLCRCGGDGHLEALTGDNIDLIAAHLDVTYTVRLAACSRELYDQISNDEGKMHHWDEPCLLMPPPAYWFDEPWFVATASRLHVTVYDLVPLDHPRRSVTLPFMHDRKWLGANGDWIAAADHRGCQWCLVNVYTERHIPLPSPPDPKIGHGVTYQPATKDWLYYLCWSRAINLLKIVICQVPTKGGRYADYKLIALFDKRIFYLEGGGDWRMLKNPTPEQIVPAFCDAIELGGQVFAVDEIRGWTYCWDTPNAAGGTFMSITLGAATKLLDDMMINYSEWHTERAPQGKKVNSVEETSSLSDKIDVIMSMLVNGRSNVDPNNVPLASLVAQEENVDVNFIKNNNFNNNAYRNNSGNNYRPYPSANGNGYGNSYGNSYNNNRNVPSGLEAMLKEFISTQTAFNKSVEEKLDKIDTIASRVDRLASDVNLLKLKVMPNNDLDNKITTTANAIQVRINENIRLMAELRARWDREENEKLAKENNVAKVWTITTTSNANSSHVAAPPTINGKIIGVGNVSTPSAKRTKLPEIAKTAETACDKTAEIFSNLGNNDPIAVAHNDLDFDDCHISEVIKFLQKLAKSPNASAINLAFTKHITNALIKAREEKLKLETSIPRKLEDGWEPIIKMKFNDFECNALCDLGASISVMPKKIYDMLDLPPLKNCYLDVNLADNVKKKPLGRIDNVHITVNNNLVPVDFVVLDIECNASCPIVLGRPFLRTVGAVIDMKEENPMSMFVIPPPVVDDQQYAWFLAPTADGKRLMIILTVNNIGIANAEVPHDIPYAANGLQLRQYPPVATYVFEQDPISLFVAARAGDFHWRQVNSLGDHSLFLGLNYPIIANLKKRESKAPDGTLVPFMRKNCVYTAYRKVYEMSSLKFDLPQLDYTTRFALWQVKMRAILAQSSDLDEAIDAFGEKAKDTWTDAEKRKDRKALSLIQLHLSNNILQEVLQEKTTAELWVKLEEICLSKDLTGRLHVKMKLFSHKLQEGGSVMNHLSSWKEIVSDLQSIEVKYEDEDLGLLLLCSLPNSFSNFRDTILLSRDKLTLAEVYDALQQKEKMKSMVQAESSSSKAEALEVRGRPEQRDNYYHNNRDKSKGDRGRSKSKGRDKFCRYCKKSNHNIDDCWKLQNKEKRNGTYQPKNNDGNGKAAVVTGKGEAAVVAGNDGSDSSDGDCLAVLAACVSRDDEWILDTACSFHICCNKDWFSSYESVQSGDFVRVGNDNQCSIVGIGSVQIKTHDGMTRTLTGVKHIPSMARNLISLSTLDCDGYKYKGGNKLLKVSSGSLIIMIGDMNSAKLYVLRGSTLPGIAAAVSSDESSKTNLWHKRLGHMSELGMAELTKRELIDGCDFGKLEFCEHCIFGKHKRVKFNASVHTTKGILDYVHADVWGPSRRTSNGGANYMLTIIDDYSRKVWPYFLKHKSDVFNAFKKWKVMVETQTEKKVKILRTDNGMEFCSNEFDEFCSNDGMVRHHTIPYTPQQNGVAERMNRTIISRARCMLSNAKMHRSFWAEAASTACYLINRSPSVPLDKKTPIEVWSGSPADYSDLRVFGCTAYAHVDNGKLEPRAVKCIFLGYGSGVKAYRLWNPETKKIVLSRNVIFNEAVMFNDSPSTDISDAIDSPDVSDDEQHRIGVQVEHAKENENVVPETNNDDNDVPPSPPFVQRQGRSIAADRPRRNIAPPTRLIQECDIVDYALSCAEQVEHDIEPATYTEAIASVDKEKWVGAMQEEMQSLEKNGTWDVVHLPKQKKAVRCKWIFKRKEGLSPNEPPRFKARLVAKGFSQIPGVDYNDVFSPVVKHSSIRAFFGIVAMHDLELEQLDVKTAFLHGELEEEIYMDQPEGYVVPGKEDLVCKLKRSLYGLKQSPRQWYKSRYMANPGKEHWKAVQWIFRYLRGTSKACLRFGRIGEGLAGYVDSDYAGDLDKRRSLTGYVFTVGGCAVSWKATLQDVVAQSTTEAEYMAIAEAGHGIVIFLLELG